MNKYDPPKNKRKSIPKKKIVQISSFEKTFSEQSQCGLGWHIKDLFELLQDYFQSFAFASFFTAKDVISIGSVCKSFRKIFNQGYLYFVIRLGNMNPEIRYLFWIHQAPYASIERQLRVKLELPSIFDDVYQKLLETGQSNSSVQKTLIEIKHDVCRTYDDPVMMTAESQQRMRNILTAIAYMYPELGYCQGMSFIVGGLMHVVAEEELAFWLFVGLIQKHHLHLTFAKGLPAVHLHMYLLGTILEMYISKLDAHLRKLGVNWDLLTAKFVLTLGAAYVPLEFLPQVFDVFFMEGWIGLYKVAVAFLEQQKVKMCEMDLEKLSLFLRDLKKNCSGVEIKRILRRATELYIQKDSIEKSIDAFFKSQAMKFLDKEYDQADWPRGFVGILQPAAESINSLLSQHETDLEYYNVKLSHIEASLIHLSRSRKQQDELKAQYVDMLIEYQGMKDQNIALKAAQDILLKSFPKEDKRKKPLQKRTGKMSTATLPAENTINETYKRTSMDKGGGTSLGAFSNETDNGKDDLEVISKKIVTAEFSMQKLTVELKEKAKEIEECKADVNEYRARWDLHQNQIKTLQGQLNEKIYEIYKEVGCKMKRESSLSVEMFNFC